MMGTAERERTGEREKEPGESRGDEDTETATDCPNGSLAILSGWSSEAPGESHCSDSLLRLLQ